MGIMKTATISTNGRIVIPKAMRVKYNLLPGDKVQIVDYGNGLTIVPLPEDPIATLRGIFADSPSMTEDLLHDRQHDWEKEDAKIGELE